MADSRVYPESLYSSQRSGAGTIAQIRVENFMCHSSLQMEFGEWINFITGQNGSGKSAILTALCVAFGCRAKGTQRAATLKDFIKRGASRASVQVKLRNEGEDAFKPGIYGQSITIDRTITESSSTIVLKDHQGKRVSSRRQELHELIDHYNIDVENPCVIMSQDKSREFLHSGNDKDRFKFFFKATLLHQVNDLLQSIDEQLKKADAILLELEASLRPIEQQLGELKAKIKNMEHVEEIAQDIEEIMKKLAWSWVYFVDRQLQEQVVKIEQLKRRIPTCQAKIDSTTCKLDSLKDLFKEKKAQVAAMFEKTSEVRRRKDELQQSLSMAVKEKAELENDYRRHTKKIQNMENRVCSLKQQAEDIQQQHVRDTQAEESEMEERLNELQHAIDDDEFTLSRLKEEEKTLEENLRKAVNEMKKIDDEIADYERKYRETRTDIHNLQQHQTNKVTAFGGFKVINLLRAIERRHQRFESPPIGPIGAHVTLVNGDTWDIAVEAAIGKLLDGFIVTNHKDSLLLRECAREAGYNGLSIFIYDFSIPRLNVPNHMLPQTNHPTVLSVLHSDNPTVLNVLVDMGGAERQVLVTDYAMGVAITFNRKVPNLKETYTSDGHKMFFRNSVQTILPPSKRMRTGRLCSSYDEKIKDLERDASFFEDQAQRCKLRKRDFGKSFQSIEDSLRGVKRRCGDMGRSLMSKRMKLKDVKRSFVPEASTSSASTIDELHQEILKIEGEIAEKDVLLEALRDKKNKAEAKVRDVRMSFESLCESVNKEADAYGQAEDELLEMEKDITNLKKNKEHFEEVMRNKVLPDIKTAETKYTELENERKENCRKASTICPEKELEALGDWDESTPEQLSNKLTTLKQRHKHESQRYPESIDDLRMLYEEKERKIYRKQQNYKDIRQKLKVCQNALDLRRKKFTRNAICLKRLLTWQFNGHLAKKGISGKTNISYDDRTLSIEVKMPQDASSNSVRDTRGLSGGERSFSTLCFAMALHGLTEAPFRAMDEFDVFMDAVSRKISLDALVEFAKDQGSQWIFITPHDISSVKPGPKVKKQQMSAPRP